MLRETFRRLRFVCALNECMVKFVVCIGRVEKYHNTLCLSSQILNKLFFSLKTIVSRKRNW